MYNHKDLESKIRKFWKENEIYRKSKDIRKEGEPFCFIDGPPYVTGDLHPGGIWNKTLKDVVVRYWMLKGYNVSSKAGFDTHGLPIEVKVEKKLGIEKKEQIEEIGIEKFIKECKEFADTYIKIMSEGFSSFGAWMDFENPYITYKDDYINSSWDTFKKAFEKGLLYEGVYVLPYCYRCETPLANYELEYGMEYDPSIYIKFPVKGQEGKFLIVWTTTPWTLVSNIAVMAHPNYSYAEISVDGEVWIIARERMDEVLEKAGKSGSIIGEMKGKELSGMEYESPLQHRIKKHYDRRVVLSEEYVTSEEGSGLVHTAPGHGPEDFAVGKKYGLEIFCPVDEKGAYTEEAGQYAGMNVREANAKIIDDLKRDGALVHAERVQHRYPHCWRCKTPLIFRTTKQWFIKISEMKEQMLESIKKYTVWYPDHAKTRFLEFVSDAPDWCVSRQRYWGIPLPIWRCSSCSEIRVIGSKEELGTDVKELHRPWIDRVKLKCKCGGEMSRVEDVLDVWFDSGNAVWAGFTEKERKEYGEVADIIIEGQDQIRGWYYSLLGSGMLRYGRAAYKRVLMHSFLVDEKGEKMSKSVGNFVPIEQFLEQYGADAYRVWCTSNTPWDELKLVKEEISAVRSELDIIYNIMNFLARFMPQKLEEPEKLEKEDEWVLSRLNTVLSEMERSLDSFQIPQASLKMREFLVNDVSRFYLKLIKDRVKYDESRAALNVLYSVLFKSSIAFSIYAPFLAEHFYQQLFRKHEGKESIVLHPWPSSNPSQISKELEADMNTVREISERVLMLRQEAGLKLRWPISKVYVGGARAIKAVSSLKEVLARVCNCNEVEVVQEKPAGNIVGGAYEDIEVYIDAKIDEENYRRGLFNEMLRRVQLMRKEMGLMEKDRIEVYIEGDEELVSIFKMFRDELQKRANVLKIAESQKGMKAKKWDIEGKEITIAAKLI
ncbi:MAG: isoleucine--tRNA ligase [Candidatus Anstonellales archaeon]